MLRLLLLWRTKVGFGLIAWDYQHSKIKDMMAREAEVEAKRKAAAEAQQDREVCTGHLMT